MTDYYKTTGTTGQMLIRDIGDNWVEFWFKAGYANDWANSLDFNYTANGSTTHVAISYPTGAQWKKVAWVYVTTSQTVTFRLLDATGTQGMGGPTTFNQYLQRETVPDPPSKPDISLVTDTSAFVIFSDGWNGGTGIDSRQIAYGTDPSNAQYYASSDGSTNIVGLQPKTTYYFWARTHNYRGYSNWSARASVTTLSVPEAPTTPLLSSARMTSVDISFQANNDNGSPITGFQIGYGTTPWTTTPEDYIQASSPHRVITLLPGTVYYFRVQARNESGWSPWSGVASIRTIAGAYVKVGATWKLAVPYVRQGGVWKLAEPWVRHVGTWKRTT